jgi:hypothetical protein
MSLIRPVNNNNLLPLRTLIARHWDGEVKLPASVQQLVGPELTTDRFGASCYHYCFFDQQVTATPKELARRVFDDSLTVPFYMVAASLLEQRFGRRDPFVVGWGLSENENNGGVYWEKPDDKFDCFNHRLVVVTKAGWKMILRGNNLVYAGMAFPRLYDAVMRRTPQISDKISAIEITVSTSSSLPFASQGESQLEITFPIRCDGYEIGLFDRTIERGLEWALNNHRC